MEGFDEKFRAERADPDDLDRIEVTVASPCGDPRTKTAPASHRTSWRRRRMIVAGEKPMYAMSVSRAFVFEAVSLAWPLTACP